MYQGSSIKTVPHLASCLERMHLSWRDENELPASPLATYEHRIPPHPDPYTPLPVRRTSSAVVVDERPQQLFVLVHLLLVAAEHAVDDHVHVEQRPLALDALKLLKKNDTGGEVTVRRLSTMTIGC